MSDRAIRLTEKQALMMWEVERCCRHFDGMACGARGPSRTIQQLEHKGLIRRDGECVLCDGDGFTAWPERYRLSMVLTDTGKAWLARDEAESNARMAEFRKRMAADGSASAEASR